MITEANAFRRALGRWFRRNGRAHLPWRENATPYAVMVSEFMLQQTTVAAVIPYFHRWMREFPEITTLAAAPEQQVLKLWEGLGYYSRARHLHRAAQAVVERFGGRIPSSVSDLRSLPGVGPYTAAAVAAFAFDQSVPVIDANIQRLLARLINHRDSIQTKASQKTLEQAAADLLPRSGGAFHTAALMDLGATVCRSGVPLCGVCPVKSFCHAVDPEQLPVKAPRAVILQEQDRRRLALSRGRVHLVPSPGPRWRGLWLLPPAQMGGIPLASVDFAVTRHRIHLEVIEGPPAQDSTAFSMDQLPPMPTPHRKALELALDALRKR